MAGVFIKWFENISHVTAEEAIYPFGVIVFMKNNNHI